MHVILWRAGLDDRVQSGMLYGGLPLAIVGFFVVERRRRARTAAPTEASPLPEEGPARD
ncbi:MAG: hypothetical protein KF708_11930 [Pirellulales bacterium]|nr:hypothetical protein [Pirellulales bacterium]